MTIFDSIKYPIPDTHTEASEAFFNLPEEFKQLFRKELQLHLDPLTTAQQVYLLRKIILEYDGDNI